ncbi:hypothetical protein LTR16_008988, partial [Cryomyces antarcticus]
LPRRGRHARAPCPCPFPPRAGPAPALAPADIDTRTAREPGRRRPLCRACGRGRASQRRHPAPCPSASASASPSPCPCPCSRGARPPPRVRLLHHPMVQRLAPAGRLQAEEVPVPVRALGLARPTAAQTREQRGRVQRLRLAVRHRDPELLGRGLFVDEGV